MATTKNHGTEVEDFSAKGKTLLDFGAERFLIELPADSRNYIRAKLYALYARGWMVNFAKETYTISQIDYFLTFRKPDEFNSEKLHYVKCNTVTELISVFNFAVSLILDTESK